MTINPRVVSHWDMCLQCRACEAVCPSGVPYGRIMANTRAQVAAQDQKPAKQRRVSRLFLRGALPHSGRLRLGARLAQVYQKSGLQTLVRGKRRSRPAARRAERVGGTTAGVQRPIFQRRRADGTRRTSERKMTVGLLSGCVMPLMQGDTMRAAVRVLTRNGCDVVVPAGQGCCGALNVHAGDLEYARSMARRNIDVFLAAGVEAVVTASAGCGSAMKEYDDLLKDDSQYAGKARLLAEMTKDITELLVSLPLDPPKASLKRRVTYQDPCHLAHAQRITAAPRVILNAIPGVELVEMEQASRCCGGAGTYSMVQRELSSKILATKMSNVAATQAEQVVTANPGCMMQLEQGLRESGRPGRVLHVVDLLDEAYRAEK